MPNPHSQEAGEAGFTSRHAGCFSPLCSGPLVTPITSPRDPPCVPGLATRVTGAANKHNSRSQLLFSELLMPLPKEAMLQRPRYHPISQTGTLGAQSREGT